MASNFSKTTKTINGQNGTQTVIVEETQRVTHDGAPDTGPDGPPLQGYGGSPDSEEPLEKSGSEKTSAGQRPANDDNELFDFYCCNGRFGHRRKDKMRCSLLHVHYTFRDIVLLFCTIFTFGMLVTLLGTNAKFLRISGLAIGDSVHSSATTHLASSATHLASAITHTTKPKATPAVKRDSIVLKTRSTDVASLNYADVTFMGYSLTLLNGLNHDYRVTFQRGPKGQLFDALNAYSSSLTPAAAKFITRCWYYVNGFLIADVIVMGFTILFGVKAIHFRNRSQVPDDVGDSMEGGRKDFLTREFSWACRATFFSFLAATCGLVSLIAAGVMLTYAPKVASDGNLEFRRVNLNLALFGAFAFVSPMLFSAWFLKRCRVANTETKGNRPSGCGGFWYGIRDLLGCFGLLKWCCWRSQESDPKIV